MRTVKGFSTAKIDRLLAKPIRYLFETPRRILKGYVNAGMLVLDVGCGTGHFSLGMSRLAGPAGHIVSVDTDAEKISALSKKAELAGLSGRIEARVCHDQDLAINDLTAQFDFALAVYVVHHVKDVPSLLGSVKRALKPGGKFLVIEPRHHASAAEREALETTARQAGFALANYPRLKRDWAVVFVKG